MLKLKKRGEMWYACGKIKGQLHRISTEIPVGTRANREAAERRCGEIDLEIRETGHGWKQDAPTFAEWWKTYKRDHLPSKGARTQKRDEGTLAHALPFFGAMRLDEVKKSDCLRYLNIRRRAAQANPRRKTPGTISEGTVQRERGLLQAIFSQAIEDGLIERNPWKGIERIDYEVRDRVVTEEEQDKLLLQLSPKFQRFLLFLLATGCRLDEVRGIDPSKNIDWRRKTVTVTGKGRKVRDIPLTDDAVQLLQNQLKDEGVLWTQNQQRLREVLSEAALRAKVPHVTPHTMRHTFGWRWLKDGGDIYTLSKILGHASVSVTEKHYAHLLKEDLARAMQARNLGLSSSVKAVVGTKGEKIVRGKFGVQPA